VTAAARREIPDQVEGLHFTAVPMREEIVGGEERRVLALEAAVGFLLLIVCANVGHLLVARASGRRRELAIRVSLGADRWRLRAQLLSESLLLGLLGGALGLVMVVVTAPLLEPLIPGDLAQEVVDGVPIDLRVVAVTLVASVAASLLFGALPALLLSSPEPKGALGSGRSGAPDRGSLRLGRGLVIGEIALTLALLSGAALLLRDFQRVNAADLGYPAENLLTFRLTLDEQRYPTGESRGRFWERLVEDVSHLPGLEAAGVTSIFPSRHGNTLSGVEVPGRPLGPGEQRLVNRRAVSPALLETLGLNLLHGRPLQDRDRAASPPVAVVSQRMAERFWPDEEAVGQRFRDSRRGPQAPWLTVVGVVSDLREAYDEGDGTLYLPMAQSLESNDAVEATLVARVGAAPTAAQAIREAVRKLDPELPLYSQATALELHAETVSQERGAATVAAAFAALGLIVALVGVYAAMAHSVARRQKEIGVRVALGCGRAGILGSVLGQGVRMVAAGCLLGGLAAIGLGRYLASVLSELDGFDPLGLFTTLTVVAASALVACLLPAWRATRIDPVRALRAE
jgi:putative ABC transport system permease protein